MRKQALILFLAIIVTVLIVDTSVMLAINMLFELTPIVEVLIGSALLMVILVPFLYLLVFLPLTQEIERHEEERKMRAELVQMVVHDLKNPLTLIVSVADLFEREGVGAVSDRHKRMVEALTISQKRLSSLIGNLLRLGTMKGKAMEVNLDVVSVRAICEDLAWINVLAQHEHKTLRRREQSTDLKVFADRELITRVLENLLINAFKHTRSGEEVSLEIERVDEKVRFAVHDNGEGIPQEYLSHIFDSMFSADHMKPIMSAGTGLGLAFCKMAIEAHDAELRVESEPGKRTSFWFSLKAGY